MTIIKKIFLALLSILLVIDINLIVLAISANETILNPGFVEYELEKFNGYSKIKEGIISNYVDKPYTKFKPYTKLINDSITEGWIKEQSPGLIYNFFSYIKSENDKINLTISTVEIKKNLLENIKKDLPISPYREDIENEISKSPNNVDLSIFLDNNAKETLKNLQKAVNYFYLGLYLLIAMALIIPILSIIITKNLKSVIRFIGSSAFMSGLISYGTGILTMDMLSQKFQSGEMPVLEKGIVLAVLQDIFEPVKTYGLILIIFGAILLILSFFIKSKK